MAAVVLDSYALLAYFRAEESGKVVLELLDRAQKHDRKLHMTEVNYAEVKYMILRKDGPEAWKRAAEVLLTLPVEFHVVTRLLADSAADFKAAHKMSLADGFAAALTKRMKAELVTGDPEFRAIEGEIKVRWIK
jgi:ribonuclease VapC